MSTTLKNKVKRLVSDFWLGENDVPDIGIDDMDFSKNGKFQGAYDQKVIELAGARRAIGNFVSILTNQDIPVVFKTTNIAPGYTDGKHVVISSSIIKREDFDWGVGLALHEGAHIVLSDMNLFSTIFKNIPMDIVNLAAKKGIIRDQITLFVKFMFNYVEDRYIDTYVFDTAPGYRGYYVALYNKFFHSEEISKALKSNGWRTRSLASYQMRVINLTNPNTDLDALPALREINQMIDMASIRRLKTTKDRLNLAIEIVRKIVEQIDPEDQKKDSSKKGNKNDTIQKILDVLGSGGKGGKKEDNVLGGEDQSDSNEYIEDIGDHGLSQSDLKKILKALDKQKQFLEGNIDKKEISQEEQKLLDIIEEAGIHIVQVQNSLIGDGIPKVDCVIVKKMTKQLIESGVLPMAKNSFSGKPEPTLVDVVNKGVTLGTILGRKLNIRREENITKFSRRRDGKIDRRILAGIGAGLEDIFYHIKTDKYGKANLHITVDASGSMDSNTKWNPTMMCVVAICKAASMITNLRVSVSFRATDSSHGMEKPYIILAYDSAVDKFEKVKLLFPYLRPSGSTPEGLAMEATIKAFLSRTLDGAEYYFLNLSDGEPYFSSQGVCYSGDVAVRHTKSVMDKLRRNGLTILSYFISESNNNDINRDQFRRMYGDDSKFINVNSVIDIARTMNEMFLRKK